MNIRFTGKDHQSNSTPSHYFNANVEQLRKRARMNIQSGALTDGYKANKDTVLDMLNQALATELVCVLRYRKHFFMAKGMDSEPIAQEFLTHSNEELSHADRLATRIVQLGGEPDFNPSLLLERSHSEYTEIGSLKGMIDENLVAERIAVESYREMIEFVGSGDPTTRRLLEDILGVEEEHAEELSNFLS